MKYDIQIQRKAREMRLSGYSLREIAFEMHVSLGLLSAWLRDVKLNDEQISRLGERNAYNIAKGRLNALISKKSKRVYEEKRIYEECERNFEEMIKNPFFVTGLTMIMIKGSHKSGTIQFSSQNREYISLIKVWFVKFLEVVEGKIGFKEYHGMYRVYAGGVNEFRKVIAWQKLLIKYHYDQALMGNRGG